MFHTTAKADTKAIDTRIAAIVRMCNISPEGGVSKAIHDTRLTLAYRYYLRAVGKPVAPLA